VAEGAGSEDIVRIGTVVDGDFVAVGILVRYTSSEFPPAVEVMNDWLISGASVINLSGPKANGKLAVFCKGHAGTEVVALFMAMTALAEIEVFVCCCSGPRLLCLSSAGKFCWEHYWKSSRGVECFPHHPARTNQSRKCAATAICDIG
jgi:hypothetical protein